ncbi:discoidin domain-containing protein [Salinispora pacifica]|uniref:discoidin domain-containing protein n=1 Tax=Salinispora pacifica TaxID=351187 RepID=UPI00048047FC|nr:discoidin domain-containing protein [Salinispora pacifica]
MDGSDNTMKPATSGTSALTWYSERAAVVGEPSAFAVVARSLPVPPGEVAVLGRPSGSVDWRDVADALLAVVSARAVVWLAVPGGGSPDTSGQVPAAVLAEHAGFEVLAPAGRLEPIPGGTLFADEGWRRFGAESSSSSDGGGQPDPAVGRRFPAPRWQPAVDPPADGGSVAGLLQAPIPAGLWVYPDAPDQPAPGGDDPAYAIPVDADRPVLLVGRPGVAAPDPDAVMAVADALPSALRGRLTVVPHGPGATVSAQVCEMLARRWACTVTMAAGVPTLHHDNRLVPVVVDSEGVGRWAPPISRLAFAPSGQPSPAGPVDFLVGLARVEPDAYQLTSEWVVEVVQSGVWLRPPLSGESTPAVRERPWQSGRMAIVVGVPGAPLDGEARRALRELLVRLPAPVRGRVDLYPREAESLAREDTPSTEAPDIALVPARTEPPVWWQADERLFSVLVELDDDGQVCTEEGVLGPGELGELITAHSQRAGRPILLVANTDLPMEFCQRVADQVPAIVITGSPHGGGWSTIRPRQVDHDELPPSRLESPYPLADHDLDDMLREPAVPVTEVTWQPACANRRRLDLRTKRSVAETGDGTTGAGETDTPDRVALLGRGPGARTPFRVSGRLASEWQVALTIATQRPEWIHCDQLITVEIDAVDPLSLQLLANYLDAPLAARRQRVDGRPAVGDQPGGRLARPRRVVGPTTNGFRSTSLVPAEPAAVAGPDPTPAGPVPDSTTAPPVSPPTPTTVAAPTTPVPEPVPDPVPVPDPDTVEPEASAGGGSAISGASGALPARTAPVEEAVPLPVLASTSSPARADARGPRRSRRLAGAVLVAATVAATGGAVVALRDAVDAGAGDVPRAAEVTMSSEPAPIAGGAAPQPTVSPSAPPTASEPPSGTPAPATSMSPVTGPTRAGVEQTPPAAAGRPTSTSATVTGRPNTTKRNLALGRVAAASSTETSTLAVENVVDGDRTTRWSSEWNDDPQWLGIDLDSVWAVTEVRLIWEEAYATRYRVELSPDGADWTTVYSTSNGTGGTVRINVRSADARYVRLVFDQRGTMWGYSLWEIDVR